MDESEQTPAHDRADDVAELLDRCADFAVRAGRMSLAEELVRHCRAIRDGDAGAIARADSLFTPDGPLHRASASDGWDEEYLGLAAAYRVESANLR